MKRAIGTIVYYALLYALVVYLLNHFHSLDLSLNRMVLMALCIVAISIVAFIHSCTMVAKGNRSHIFPLIIHFCAVLVVVFVLRTVF